MRSLRWPIVGLSLLLVLLFLVSLPGFGIETRSYNSYAKWAAPVFLVFTLLVFVAGIGAAVLARNSPRRSALAGILAGLAAIVTVALDTSAVGGPSPPTAPLVLGLIAAIAGAVLIAAAFMSLRQESCRESEPSDRTKNGNLPG